MKILWPEVALSISVLLFIITNSWIGYIIAFNGLLTHVAFAIYLPIKNKLRLLDATCNVCFTLYVNMFPHAQPQVGVITLISFISWRCNQFNSGNIKAIIHAVLVQLPLFIGLNNYYLL
tara:strand:- start:70 stop:426 length:357 start_codon:yes stop_codon:yes gene_type:complete